jgi:hypothetical protein
VFCCPCLSNVELNLPPLVSAQHVSKRPGLASVLAQQISACNACRAAATSARVAARDISTVSIHGTGTPLGDPIETGALGQALKRGGGDAGAVLMLSNKACFGHTEGTAGLSGDCRGVLTPHAHVGTWQGQQPAHEMSSVYEYANIHCSRVWWWKPTRTSCPSREASKGVVHHVFALSSVALSQGCSWRRLR